ncbi:hypothetical protein J1605_006742 [Eschrichtius robustus]|uniref:Uncharacterized protein n=1 Tax=Eschrichtius robustus TaxID=9764 RepID=A0AB34H3L3_ESCRO|nr:hypothetical protein J1605_006742 [Eschrichtius robustus]
MRREQKRVGSPTCSVARALLEELGQVILKDLEVLAEIASSPAGQMDDPGPLDGPDLRVSHSELQVPTPGRAGLLKTPGVRGGRSVCFRLAVHRGCEASPSSCLDAAFLCSPGRSSENLQSAELCPFKVVCHLTTTPPSPSL